MGLSSGQAQEDAAPPERGFLPHFLRSGPSLSSVRRRTPRPFTASSSGATSPQLPGNLVSQVAPDTDNRTRRSPPNPSQPCAHDGGEACKQSPDCCRRHSRIDYDGRWHPPKPRKKRKENEENILLYVRSTAGSNAPRFLQLHAGLRWSPHLTDRLLQGPDDPRLKELGSAT